MTQSNQVRPLTIQLIDDQGKVIDEHHFAQEKIVIGRILSADLKIEDPSVSRVHALLEVMPSRMTITDLASAHGTYIENKKILAGELKVGQRVRVGQIWLQISDGAIDKVPQDFRQKYSKSSMTPPLGTAAPSSGAGQAAQAPAAPHSGPERRAKEPPPPSPKTPKRRQEDTLRSPEDWRPKNFTKEIVREHENVLGQGQALSLTVYWYENVLDETILRDPTILRIGEGPRNDYVIPMGAISPPESFNFIEVKERQAILNLHSSMDGHLRLRDHSYSVKDRGKIPGAVQNGEVTQVRIGQKDFAKITLGTITFFLIYVPEPPVPPMIPFLDRDPRFRKLAVLVFLVMILVGILFGFVINTNIKPRVEDIPERLRPLLIDPKKALERQARLRGNEGEGERKKGDEGKRGKKDVPKQKEGETKIPKGDEAKAKQKEAAKKKVVGKGVLGALRGSLGAALGKAAKGGAGVDNVNQLTLGTGGGAAGSGSGYGTGTALKGTGYGGGGRANVAIGGLGTKGSGYGAVGSGGGAIPGKGEASISTLGENVQVLGSLPKEVIERVINRHLNEIKFCYEAELQRYPNLKGKIVIGWTIMGTGRVSNASVVESTMNNRTVENCIVNAVRRWIFPKPAGGGVVVIRAYPFIFQKTK